jgi:regulatory protein
MLERRAYGTDELRRRLERRGIATDEIERVIERLTAAGVLDDAAYARQVARAKLAGARHAPRRVRQELVRRGVPRDLIESALDDVVSEEGVDTGAQLLELARRRATTLQKLHPTAQRRRLYAYLARRGYGGEEIGRVVAEVLKG